MTSRTSDNNPFASRFIRPGAVPFRFAEGRSAESLCDDLERQAWWGQIIGPHGSGKSTLLATLVDALEEAGRRPVQFTLHDGQRKLPPGEFTPAAWDAQTQVVVDGYEQLSWFSRTRLKRACRRRRAGLLVTAHVDLGLPTLCETTTTEDIAWQVVEHLLAYAATTTDPNSGSRTEVATLLANHAGNLREVVEDLVAHANAKNDSSPEPRGLVTRTEVAALLTRHEGNLREVLFELYDVYEQQRT